MDQPTLREVSIKIAQYFRDFLESDFKRQQTPKRRIILQSETGFRAGMRATPYPELNRELWNLLSKPSGEPLALSLAPRRYTRSISAALRKVIQEQIKAIAETALVAVRIEVESKARQTLSSALKNPEEWIDAVRATLAGEASTQIVRPLIAHLDGPLRQQAYSVIDSLYAAETDLVQRVVGPVDERLADALAKYLATQDAGAVGGVLNEFLTLEGIRGALESFFDGFVASDAFLEFQDLATYVGTNDGLQLYLYVGNLRYGNVAYPLFFLPIEAVYDREKAQYRLTIVNQLYTNRRALDFALQQLAAGHNREWINPIKERITYLKPEQSIFEVVRSFFRQIAAAVDLGGQADLGSAEPDVSTAHVTLSSALYLCAFERADEALLNDYENLIDLARRSGGAVVSLFEGLVQGILKENPVSIASEVESDWDRLPLVDRVVFDSPIPLNEEQRKILLAVRHPLGRIIVVEGPPGTGKSHTITAIAADCAFNQRSCLILSDKAEALAVVQNKLSDAMSRVRHDKDFPNPILRIGQQNANFKKLTSNQTVTQIGHYARSMRANQPALEAERKETAEQLRSVIDRTVRSLGSVAIVDLRNMHDDEAALESLAPTVAAAVRRQNDCRVLLDIEGLTGELEAIRTYLEGVFAEGDYVTVTLASRLRRDTALLELLAEAPRCSWSLFERLDIEELRRLGQILLAYDQLRMPLFRYLFRGRQVRTLEAQLNALPVVQPLLLKRDVGGLREVATGASALRLKLEKAEVSDTLGEAYRVLARGQHPAEGARPARAAFDVLRRLDVKLLDAMLAEPEDDPQLWPMTLRFLRTWLSTRKAFDEAPAYDYIGAKTKLERLNTSVMNAHIDGRLVKFMENHRADAKTLASLIANRQKFPEEKFDHVREAFPVTIASIREFGEYMPLVPELFDVVVIDEASQVSVAQALPAMLRAKKVVVLGDSKQFSNVKSANASIALNSKYRGELLQFFKATVSDDAEALQRLAMFDVKKSVLEFCSLAASYSTMLRKHFRSYQELIGYSSSTFYGNQLQAIKIRCVPLDEVIRFDQVDATSANTSRGTNETEAQFILDRLVELLGEADPPTVGVITPFREQQTLLTKLLFGHSRSRDFEDKLRLKVMTFDSCQGEERQIIFYSMVATPRQDALNYVFPVSLENAAESVEEKLKIQRLNVGFSRAQEMIWFVHSMPLGEYRGSIGQALHHYANRLLQSDVRPDQTDPASPMEAKVLDWLQKTAFVQGNMERIELRPQFPIGDYLRQLDPMYQHPAWRVDFLVTFQAERGPVYIVVEYDGFEYHFAKSHGVHVGNHERYLNAADVERQLTLESYGYRFLRINRFNVGADPIATLSDRLTRLVEDAGGEPVAAVLQKVQAQAAGLADGNLRPCERCGQIRALEAFFDPTLRNGSGGRGRICMVCKKAASPAGRQTTYGRSWGRARR